MAGKLPVFASPRLRYACDKMSKNTLIDLVIDLAKLQIGQEDASDNQVAAQITEWLHPVAHARGDRPIDLGTYMAIFDRHAQDYLKRREAAQ